MAKFATGEIVQLKSGGPKMTVGESHMLTDEKVFCQWFAGSKLESGRFAAETLVKVDGEAGGSTKKK